MKGRETPKNQALTIPQGFSTVSVETRSIKAEPFLTLPSIIVLSNEDYLFILFSCYLGRELFLKVTSFGGLALDKCFKDFVRIGISLIFW